MVENTPRYSYGIHEWVLKTNDKSSESPNMSQMQDALMEHFCTKNGQRL